MRRRFLLPLMVLLSAAACSGRDGDAEPGPLLVLVTLDTLRWDAFAEDMPRTREWALEARVYDRHLAATTTTQPTHASLLTGLHPWQHGVTRNGLVLAERHETLAEILRDAGWRTGAVTASFPLHRLFGWSQGFDVFVDEFDHAEAERWNGVEVPEGNFYSLATETTDRALAVLDELGSGPAFLWIHYYDPHSPYGDAYDGRVLTLSEIYARLERAPETAGEVLDQAREAYRGDVHHLDDELARLFARLGESERTTHVVLTADHGESFGEDGALGHGKGLGEEQLRVPLVVRSPLATRGTSHLFNGSVDVFATALALAGLEPRGSGSDVLPREGGGEALGMRRTFVEPFREVRADGSVRLVSGLEFYRATTAGMARGNATEIDGVRSIDGFDARERFAAWEAALEGAPTVQLDDPEALRAMEALGYVQ